MQYLSIAYQAIELTSTLRSIPPFFLQKVFGDIYTTNSNLSKTTTHFIVVVNFCCTGLILMLLAISKIIWLEQGAVV